MPNIKGMFPMINLHMQQVTVNKPINTPTTVYIKPI